MEKIWCSVSLPSPNPACTYDGNVTILFAIRALVCGELWGSVWCGGRSSVGFPGKLPPIGAHPPWQQPSPCTCRHSLGPLPQVIFEYKYKCTLLCAYKLVLETFSKSSSERVPSECRDCRLTSDIFTKEFFTSRQPRYTVWRLVED